MKIYKKKDKIIVELDYYQHKCNPYSPEEEEELTDNLIGIQCGSEQGIAKLIDLSYKYDQQVGQIMVNTCFEDEEFEKLCEKLKIGYFKYETCAYCLKPIYGSHGFGDKGNKCMNCEYKEQKEEGDSE